MGNRLAKPQTTPFRTAEKKRTDRLLAKQFVIWDGEGITPSGTLIQDYVLFGYYDGINHDWIASNQLTTDECLALIIDSGRLHKNAIHVGFAFNYDVDMILRDMPEKSFRFLRQRGYVRYKHYKIKHLPNKWFKVYNLKKRIKVTIFDVWGFFQSSLVSALKSTIADHPKMSYLPKIEEGKNRRGAFTKSELPYVLEYWQIENELAHALVTRLREYLYNVGLRITQWHGPGAIASFGYRINHIDDHKRDCGPDIYAAARYAYAGGRFERFHIGRYRKVYGYDINSAYPNAIAKLPSLAEGKWIHNDHPKRIVEFGIYRVSMRGPAISSKPAPLFHRDKAGNITYPWRLDGWYWSPEIKAIIRTMPHSRSVRIREAYEYVGWKTRPFEWVKDVYNQRREMKASGAGAQMALKLFLNSLYGKMAQRAGWERTGSAPHWHQLEWAGWVTSYTRAMLYELMAQIPYDKLIAVETDGIYTTAGPDEITIKIGDELGQWEMTYYDEMIYLQSGLYAKRQKREWSLKYRGLDKDSVSIELFRRHPTLLKPNKDWPKMVGKTTRFVGYRNALWRGPFNERHCAWEIEPKEISCGDIGKRIHSTPLCKACQLGKNAYALPHDTIIKSKTMVMQDDELMSCMHDIPWLDNEISDELFDWREFEESQEGLVSWELV